MDSRSLKIGPITYRIEVVEQLEGEDGQELCGRYQNTKCLIQLDSALPAPFARVVLWHEIIHALLEQSGREQDEGLCDAFGYAITQILMDNPWLAVSPAET